MQETTGRRFLQSTIASYTSLLVRLGVTFGARVVLARLIIPADHGLYDMAFRVVMIAAAVRDLGLPFHLMRDRDRPYGTVLGFSLVQGALLTALLILAAPALGGLDPALPAVLQVFAVWVLLDAFVQVPKVFFERELRIGRIAGAEVARGLAMAAVAIALAWQGWGVWSLVIGDLVASAVFAVIVWARAWGQLPLDWEPRRLTRLLRQSTWLFAIWIVLQCVQYVDAFVIGALRQTADVGQYVKAYMIAFLVPQIVAPRALLPALVEYQHDPPRFLAAFRLGTLFLMAFQVTAGYFLFLNAPKVVSIILGDQWEPAVALLRVLCFVPFLDVFTDLGGEVLKVRHEDRVWLLTAVLNLVSLVGFGIWFTSRWGALGMAAANFLLVGNLLMAWRMAGIFGPGFRLVLRDLLAVYLVPLPLLALATLAPADSWARFWGSGLLAGVALAALYGLYRRPLAAFLEDRSSP